MPLEDAGRAVEESWEQQIVVADHEEVVAARGAQGAQPILRDRQHLL